MADKDKLPSIEERLISSARGSTDPSPTEHLTPKRPELPPMPPELQEYMEDNFPANVPQAAPESPVSRNAIEDFGNAFEMNGFDAPVDPFKMGKKIMGDFRNPDLQSQFYERYAEHPEFQKLGFNPFIDNEALYNENASWWDDTRRAAGQAWTLGWLGFKDALGFGALSDTKVAREYERAMAIGQSSKGGIGGFTTNLMLNSGYTLGIMNELAMEEGLYLIAEAGLAYAGVFTGGATWAGNAAVGVQMAARGARAGNKIWKAWKTGRTIVKHLDRAKDINKARTTFGRIAGKTGKFLNPLENTTDFIRASGKMDNITGLGKTVRGFGEFYKDIRNVRLAYGESALEGGMVENQVAKELFQEFQQEHGRLPNEQEAAEIRQHAVAAGQTAALTNMPTIFFSNRVMFDGLINGRFRHFGSDVIDMGKKGKMLFKPRNGVKNPYKALPDNYFKARWEYIRDPRMWLSGAVKYGKANFMEGTQEVLQEAIADGAAEYYKAKFKGDGMKGGYMSYLASGLKKQASPLGFETFMSGFLMGGLVSPISKVTGATMHGKQSLANAKLFFGDHAKWKKMKADRQDALERDAQLLNDFYAEPEKYLAPDLINMLEQKEFAKAMKVAQENGDIKTFYDMKNGGENKHLLTALRYGRMDTHIQRLQELKGLSAEDIKESWPSIEDPAEFQKAMDIGIARAKRMHARWETAKAKYPNPFNPSKYNSKTNEDAYKEESYKALAWDNAIEEMVFQQASFDEALERQEKILRDAKKVSGLKNTPVSDINVLFSQTDMLAEIARLRRELHGDKQAGIPGLKKEGVEPLTEELGKLIEEKSRKLENLTAFENAIKDIIVNYGKNESISEEDYAKAHKAFITYMEDVAQNNEDFVNNDNLDNALQSMLDYHLLKERSRAANRAVNTLLDPEGFSRLFERATEVNRVLHENRLEEIRNSLKAYTDMMDDNRVLQQLFEKGMFFDPAEFVALKEDGVLPTAFYYTTEKGELASEVFVNAQDYKEAVSILEDYYEHLTGKQIPENKYDPYTIGQSREKNKEDTEKGIEADERTYKDLADEYGFDPKKAESYVPLQQVLEAIARSPHSTDREKELAKKLAKIANNAETVTFVNNSSKAGDYTATKQTVIDARYMSHDYEMGKEGHPIEHVILHQEIRRRTVQELESDPEFRGEMQGLLDQAKKTLDSLPEDDRLILTGATTGTFYGLTSLEAFVAESMSNDTFQKFLATIKTETKTEKTTGWKKFIDAVIEKITEILGKPNGTVLNAAMDIITSKIDLTYGAAQQKAAKAKAKAAPKGVTNKMSISKLRKEHPELAKEVMDLFLKKNQERIDQAATPFIDNIDELSPDEIYKHDEFLMFFRNPEFVAKEQAIIEYNKSQEEVKVKASGAVKSGQIYRTPVTEAEYAEFLDTKDVSQKRLVMLSYQLQNNQPTTKEEGEMINELRPRLQAMIDERSKDMTNEIITGDMKKQLKDLGYKMKWRDPETREVIKMTPATAQRYIAEGLTSQEREELETVPVEDPAIVEQHKQIRHEITSMIDGVKTFEQWKTVDQEIRERYRTEPELRTIGKFDQTELGMLMNNKLTELAFARNFEDVVVGEVLIMNNKFSTKAKVIEKTEDTITVRNTQGKGETWTIKADQMEEKVKYLYSEALKEHGIKEKEEITEEDKEFAAETNENVEEVSPERLKASIEKGETTDKSEIGNSLLDSIC